MEKKFYRNLTTHQVTANRRLAQEWMLKGYKVVIITRKENNNGD